MSLGGCGQIGMNMCVYGYGGRMIVVDVGKQISLQQYGIDQILPDIHCIPWDKVDAVFLTHGHEDHIGALMALCGEITVPVYATSFTVGLTNSKIAEGRSRPLNTSARSSTPRLVLCVSVVKLVHPDWYLTYCVHLS